MASFDDYKRRHTTSVVEHTREERSGMKRLGLFGSKRKITLGCVSKRQSF